MSVVFAVLLSLTVLFSVAAASTVALWVAYLACMNLKSAYDSEEMTRPAYWLGVLVVAVFYALDFFVNFYVCSVLFMDLPRECTVTERLNREYSRGGWRADISSFIAKHFLNRYDPSGKHCDFVT